jgi:Flp pilus assembly pilin Flp
MREMNKHGSWFSRRIAGQASIEYTMVLILVMLVLIEGGDESPIAKVVTALKDYFGAYSWAMHFSNNLTPF